MRKVQIVTDSACDIPKEYEEKYNIRILPFPIAVGDQSYTEREDFTPDEFYGILQTAPKTPTTAQYTAHRFGELYEELYADGVTDVIYVSINGKGSATSGNSIMARDTFYEEHPEAKDVMKIYVVDSRSYSMGYGLPVIGAAKKAQKGASTAEILAYLEDWFQSCRVVFAPYTLEFVKKSGRVSCAAAFVGELIGLKPIIEFIDGESVTIGKVRGEKAVAPAILKKMQAEMIPHTPYVILEGSEPSYADDFSEQTEKLFGDPCAMRVKIGAAISINAGHKILGVVYKGKPRT